MTYFTQLFTGFSTAEHRMLFMSVEKSEPSSTPLPLMPDAPKLVEKPEAKTEGAEGYARHIALEERETIKQRIESFLENDGKVLGEEISQINAMIEKALRGMQSLGEKTLNEFNQLIADLPTSNETLVNFAMRVGLLTPEEIQNIAFRAGQKNTMRTPGQTGPGIPSDPYNLPDYTAYMPGSKKVPGGPEIQKEVAEAQLFGGLQQARQDVAALNAARSQLLRQYRADRRMGMNPSQRAQRYNQISAQLRAMRDGMGNPTARYWAVRNQWEATSGISYSRYLREQKGETMLPGPATKEESLKYKITDERTGRTLAVYDQWTGSYSGRMPREQAMGIISSQSHPSIFGKEARIVVDGALYVAPRSGRAIEIDTLIPNNVSLRERLTRKYLAAKGPYNDPYNGWNKHRSDASFAPFHADNNYTPGLFGTTEQSVHLENPRITFVSSTPSATPLMSALHGVPRYERYGQTNPELDAIRVEGFRRMDEINRAAQKAFVEYNGFGSTDQHNQFKKLVDEWGLTEEDDRSKNFRYRFDEHKNMEIGKKQLDGTWLYAKIDNDGDAYSVETRPSLPESMLNASERETVAKANKVKAPEPVQQPESMVPPVREKSASPSKSVTAEEEKLKSELALQAEELGVKGIFNWDKLENTDIEAILLTLKQAIKSLNLSDEERAVLKTMEFSLVDAGSAYEVAFVPWILISRTHSAEQVKKMIEKKLHDLPLYRNFRSKLNGLSTSLGVGEISIDTKFDIEEAEILLSKLKQAIEVLTAEQRVALRDIVIILNNKSASPGLGHYESKVAVVINHTQTADEMKTTIEGVISAVQSRKLAEQEAVSPSASSLSKSTSLEDAPTPLSEPAPVAEEAEKTAEEQPSSDTLAPVVEAAKKDFETLIDPEPQTSAPAETPEAGLNDVLESARSDENLK